MQPLRKCYENTSIGERESKSSFSFSQIQSSMMIFFVLGGTMSSKIIDCPNCQGEGYGLAIGNMTFSSRDEVYEESEVFVVCKTCKGEGKLEVCSICLEPYQIDQGIEICACISIKLPKAA
jgi:DnaJ-class molecular chaperone